MPGPDDQRRDRFGIEAESVAAYRMQLREMARGVPIAESAIEGFSDWQVVEAMERLWAAGTIEPEPPEPTPGEPSPMASAAPLPPEAH